MTSPHRILVARLNGAARRHGGWAPPTGDARAAAIENLRTIGGDQPAPYAETAGIMLGAHPPGDATHHQFHIAAHLLLEAAGLDLADEDVQRWIEVGAERRARGQEAMRAGDHWARSDF